MLRAHSGTMQETGQIRLTCTAGCTAAGHCWCSTQVLCSKDIVGGWICLRCHPMVPCLPTGAALGKEPGACSCRGEHGRLCVLLRGAAVIALAGGCGRHCSARHMQPTMPFAVPSSSCQPVRQSGMSAGRSLCSGTPGTLAHPLSNMAPHQPWARVPRGRPPAMVNASPAVRQQATASRSLRTVVSGMLLLHVLHCPLQSLAWHTPSCNVQGTSTCRGEHEAVNPFRKSCAHVLQASLTCVAPLPTPTAGSTAELRIT